MSDELLIALNRFHREVLLPEVKDAIRESEQQIREEALTHFDSIDQRFDRLESECLAVVGSVRRIESQLGRGRAAVQYTSSSSN